MALQSIFTGLFCCILFFHPSTKFYCLGRLSSHQPSSSRRKKAPSPPTPASSHTPEEETLSHPSSLMKIFSSKHKQNSNSHDKPSHVNPPQKSHPQNLPSFKPNNTVPIPRDNSVSELFNGESAGHVIQRIFRTGWRRKAKNPTIEKVLKINHSTEALKGFEEYREMVKSLAAKTSISKREERWVVDGNELLRFHCSATASHCRLVCRENSSICERKHHCGICNTIRYGFSSGVLEKVALCESSWRAHEVMGQEELRGRRAMLVCRVIAGRVAHQQRQGLVKGEEGVFDSLMGMQRDLFVLDPKSVLPCFIVIYKAK